MLRSTPLTYDPNYLIPITVAKRLAEDVKDATDVLNEYGGLPVRFSLTQSTHDLDLLSKRLVGAGVGAGECVAEARAIIARMERAVVVWKAKDGPAKKLERLKTGVLDVRFQNDEPVQRTLYPVLLELSKYVLDTVKAEPKVFTLFMGERAVRPGADNTYSIEVGSGIAGKRKKIAFELMDPLLMRMERVTVVTKVLDLAGQAAHAVVGMALRGYAPAVRYRTTLRTHPLIIVRDTDKKGG
ncbi:MAG: hypothetical protein FJ319_02575 [SAR202 cluster bacterium]|nr:hypothetical protein [SAR202 cluster bacterium]